MVVAGYAKRFTCEESYRDSENAFYEGFQLNGVKLGTPERWDRLFLVFAWARIIGSTWGDGTWKSRATPVIGKPTLIPSAPMRYGASENGD